MRKKLLMLTCIIAIIAVMLSHHDPLQMVVNFIVGGVVPGMNVSLSFIPTLGVILLLLLLMRRWVKELHFQMIRRTALEMNAEKTSLALTTAHSEERLERRAVVAARSLETNA